MKIMYTVFATLNGNMSINIDKASIPSPNGPCCSVSWCKLLLKLSLRPKAKVCSLLMYKAGTKKIFTDF